MSKVTAINKKQNNKTQLHSLRQVMLAHGEDVINTFINYSLGKLEDFKGDAKALEVAYKSIVPQMRLADDVVNMPKLTDIPNPQQRIEKLLDMASSGECSITTASNLIEILIKQVDVQDAEEIRKALDQIAANQR